MKATSSGRLGLVEPPLHGVSDLIAFPPLPFQLKASPGVGGAIVEQPLSALKNLVTRLQLPLIPLGLISSRFLRLAEALRSFLNQNTA